MCACVRARARVCVWCVWCVCVCVCVCVCEVQCFGSQTERDLLEFPSLATLSNTYTYQWCSYTFRYPGRVLATVAT